MIRQCAILFEMCIRDRPNTPLFLFSKLETPVVFKPVSYTHLDVYKRQTIIPTPIDFNNLIIFIRGVHFPNIFPYYTQLVYKY